MNLTGVSTIDEKHFKRIKPCLKPNEKVEILTTANIKGNVIAAVTNKRIILRPGTGILKSTDERAVSDISYNSIDALRESGVVARTIEIEALGKKYPSIDKKEGLVDYITKKAKLQKAIACPDCKSWNLYTSQVCKECGASLVDEKRTKVGREALKRGAGFFGAIIGTFGAIVCFIFGLLICLVGVLLCLTIIGAILGIPAIIFGGMLMLGALGFGGLAWVGGKTAFKRKPVEWRRLRRVVGTLKPKTEAAREVASGERESKGYCIIATCALPSQHPDLQYLRRFRDEVLRPTKLGRFITYLYYALSPPIAVLVLSSKQIKRLVRKRFIPFWVKICKEWEKRESQS